MADLWTTHGKIKLLLLYKGILHLNGISATFLVLAILCLLLDVRLTLNGPLMDQTTTTCTTVSGFGIQGKRLLFWLIRYANSS